MPLKLRQGVPLRDRDHSALSGSASMVSDSAKRRHRTSRRCHACEVEVDPDTGRVTIERYLRSMSRQSIERDDLVEGCRDHGWACARHRPGDARRNRLRQRRQWLLVRCSTTSFRLNDVPGSTWNWPENSVHDNPLGVEGVGESGAIGAPPSGDRRVLDALRPFEVTDLLDAGQPDAVWQAIGIRTIRASRWLNSAGHVPSTRPGPGCTSALAPRSTRWA